MIPKRFYTGKIHLLFFISLLTAGIFTNIQAQLCTGSLGDPVVNITFGSGTGNGLPLAAATTNYRWLGVDCPNDGFYTVASKTSQCFGNTWYTVNNDHTGNPNGYFMLVNASFAPSDFYVDTVRGLCAGTTYEFAAWVMNVLLPSACNGNGIRPNLTFSIEATDGTVLQSYNTSDIQAQNGPVWKQYGFYFATSASTGTIVLRIKNNAPGGCGNDLALDDITFRPCGPLVTASMAGNGTNLTKSFCEGDLTSLTFQGSVAAGYAQPAYQWQLSTDTGATWKDIPGAVTTTFVRSPTGPGTYQYRMNVAQVSNIQILNCRVSSNLLTVTVNRNPDVVTAFAGVPCENTDISLSATTANPATFAWTGPNGFTAATSPAPIHAAPLSAAGKYYVMVTDQNNCKTRDSLLLNVYPQPNVKALIPGNICSGQDIRFVDKSTAGGGQTIVKWNWQFSTGDSSVQQNPMLNLPYGNYTINQFSVETDKGCPGVLLNQSFTIHPYPVVRFGLPEICLLDPFAAFSDSSSIADGTSAQFSYAWNFGDPASTAANPNTSAQQNPKHAYTAIGVYPVKLTVTSAAGCAKDTTEQFTVNGSLPLAAFTVANAGALCSNQQVVLTDHSSVNFGSVVRLEIYWNYANDPLQKTVDENPAPGKQYFFQYPDFALPATKSYQVRYVAYSGINCVNESTTTITLNASPQVQFDALNPVCEDLSPFTITQGHQLTQFSGTGTYSGTGISPAGVFNPSLAGAGTDSLYYRFTAANGCSAVAGQSLLVYPKPTADAGPDRTSLEGGFIVLNGSGTGNNISYAWTPDSAIQEATTPTPKISPSNDIVYTLTVTSADGCKASDQVFVKVLKKPIVPNAFSPNGDGINDTWVIRYLDAYPGAEVNVYNRYGQIVYQSTGYQTPWNGTLNGQPLPVATYYWIINPHNGRSQMNGSVTIVR